MNIKKHLCAEIMGNSNQRELKLLKIVKYTNSVHELPLCYE